MPSHWQIFLTFILPCAVVAIALLTCAWTLGRIDPAVALVAMGISIAWGLMRIMGAPRWPPGTGDVTFWLFWFNLVATLLAAMDGILSPPPWLRAVVLLLLLRLACRAIIAPGLHFTDAATSLAWDAETWIDLAASVALIWWLLLDALVTRLSAVCSAILLVLITGSAAAIHYVTYNIKPSMLCILLTGIAVTLTMVAGQATFLMKLRDGRINRAVALVMGAPLLAAFAIDHFYSYSEPAPLCVAAWLAAPLLGVTILLPTSRNPGRWKSTLPLMLIALALVGAVSLAFHQNKLLNATKTLQATHSDEY